MFAYCGNNPIEKVDSNGCLPSQTTLIKSTVKFIAKHFLKPQEKTVQQVLSSFDATVSAGINLSGSPSFWILNGQGGFSIDTKGNVAAQFSFGGGVTGGTPGASLTGYVSVTDAPLIKKLEGEYSQIGASASFGVCGGADFMFIPDAELDTTYHGVTVNAGLGTPGAEVHVEWGETWTDNSSRFNVFDVFDRWYSAIMEW